MWWWVKHAVNNNQTLGSQYPDYLKAFSHLKMLGAFELFQWELDELNLNFLSGITMGP